MGPNKKTPTIGYGEQQNFIFAYFWKSEVKNAMRKGLWRVCSLVCKQVASSWSLIKLTLSEVFFLLEKHKSFGISSPSLWTLFTSTTFWKPLPNSYTETLRLRKSVYEVYSPTSEPVIVTHQMCIWLSQKAAKQTKKCVFEPVVDFPSYLPFLLMLPDKQEAFLSFYREEWITVANNSQQTVEYFNVSEFHMCLKFSR